MDIENTIDVENIIPLEDTAFEQGMPDYIGKNYAITKDNFWQTEIEYNGFNE